MSDSFYHGDWLTYDNLLQYDEDVQDLFKQLSSQEEPKPIDLRILEESFDADTKTVLAINNTVDKKVIGMGTVCFFMSRQKVKAVIEDVVVHSDYRGRGIAKQIMQTLHHEITERSRRYDGVGVATTLTSKSSRKEAHGLYESLGYVLIAKAVDNPDGTNLFMITITSRDEDDE